MMRNAFVMVIILIFTVFIGILGALYGYNPFVKQEPIKIHIAANMTGREIANLLKSRGVIYNETVFRGALYVSKAAYNLQEGDYDLRTNMSMMRVVDKLQHGRMEMIRVVIPEGFYMTQIAQRLEESGVCSADDFLAAAKVYCPEEEMRSDRPVEYAAEGFLFPDTYEFTANTSPQQVLDIMHAEWKRRMTPEVRERLVAQHLTVHDFITLASLVEKEARVSEDRGVIAAIFKKRLAMGMPLQSCASIQYILGKAKPLLSVEDTQLPSLYNTYLHQGLPPGPISAPGEAAMNAVLFSPSTEYLFFVAKQDGHHLFAKTYEEHEQNILQVYGDE